jgi:uncharacterized RDD family membrane protein YckC
VAPLLVLGVLLLLGLVADSFVLTMVLAAAGSFGLLLFFLWNSCYQQGLTGRSLGRRVTKTRLVKIGTGAPLGFGAALLRQLCHGLEFGIGYLWPLWDSRRQTFADKIVGSLVIRAEEGTGYRAPKPAP